MKRVSSICTLLFLMNTAFINALPKQYIFRHITTENGLVSNFIKCIIQDSQGFIWTGSQSGLQRYDGYRFLTFLSDLHNPNALQTDWISHIFEDSHHRLWIATDKESPYLYNRNSQTFYNYNLHAKSDSNKVLGTWTMAEDGNGDIWICGHKHYYRLDKTSNQFMIMDKILGLSATSKTCGIKSDNNGNIWITTTDGVAKFDVKENRVYNKNYNPEKLKVFDLTGVAISITFDESNNLWLNTSSPNFLYKYNQLSNAVKQYVFNRPVKDRTVISESSEMVSSITNGGNGSVIVSMIARGFAIYDVIPDTFSLIEVNNKDPNGLHMNIEAFSTISSFKDREGNIWVATDKGLNIFNPDQQRFSTYGEGIGASAQYPAYPVSGLIQTPDKGDVYVSYYYFNGGVIRLDSNLHFKQHYLYYDNNQPNTPKNQIWFLHRDETGNIIAPNQNKTILKIDPVKNSMEENSDPTYAGPINTIQRDDNGDTWIGHWFEGLIRCRNQDHSRQSFTKGPTPFTDHVQNVRTLFFDHDIIWVGTALQGLLVFDKKKEQFTESFAFDQDDKNSISSNGIVKIIAYNADTLLLATEAGINIFNKRTKTFSLISTRDGLPNNLVETIALDRYKNLWVGAESGFSRINIKTLAITNYGIQDGIGDNVFNNADILKLKNGKFIVSTVRGFIVFNPDSMSETNPPPDVRITEFTVYDSKIKIDSLMENNKVISLSHEDNSIRIEFSSLQFSFSDKIKYYYRMDGVDKDWILADKDQAARYNQLRSGSYSFHVKCINRDGIVSTAITTLDIRIIPPFYDRWWFYLIMIISGAGLLYYLLSWNQKRRKEKEQLRRRYEKKIAEVEMNTLRAQMNPHFIFNSLNSINDFILSNDPDNASGYLTKFSRLMRLILDNSRSEWVLLENELKALRLYIDLEAVRFDNAFSYDIVMGEDVSSSAIIPPLIIQPYVENAIWHGLLHGDKIDGHIHIKISRCQSNLCIEISDNGIGREAARQQKSKTSVLHKSHGMKITAERLAIVNNVYDVNAEVEVSDIASSDNEPAGTKVLLTLKYQTNGSVDH